MPRSRMPLVPLVLALLGILMGPGSARAQADLRVGGAEADLGGRLQLQALTSSCAAYPIEEPSACTADVPGLDWFLRRARLTFTVRVNEWIEGRIEPDFADVDAVQLKDAWGRLRLNDAARLTIGHYKRPFDGFQMTSSTEILTIERDVDIPGVPGLVAASLDELTTRFRLSDRDVGIMLDGGTADGRFRYWLGAFNGGTPEDNEDVNTEKQVIGRGQVSLGVAGLPLDLAAAAALTDVPFTREDGRLAGRYFGAFEAWAELGDFDGGPHVQAGLVLSGNPLQNPAGGPVDLEGDEDFASALAWQAIGTYKFPIPDHFFLEAVEPLFRVTRADPNTDLPGDAAWGFTPGVQIFFDGRNKLAINWDLVVFPGEDRDLRAEHSLKAQYQLHF